MSRSGPGGFPVYRPQFPEPEPRWYVYLAWGYVPAEEKTLLIWLIDLLLGPQLWLLYVGMTYRTGPVRWNEHFGLGIGRYLAAPKFWAPHTWMTEIIREYGSDDRLGYPTEAEARAREAYWIHRLQPLANTAGKGRADRRGPVPATARKHQRPQRQRALGYVGGALAALWAYLTVSLPRLVTGAWPQGWEWLLWALTPVALAAAARYWMTSHPVGWLTATTGEKTDVRHHRLESDRGRPSPGGRPRSHHRPDRDPGRPGEEDLRGAQRIRR